MKTMSAILSITAISILSQSVSATETSESILFENVRIFDGVSNELTEKRDVLVTNNKIVKIAEDLPPNDAQIINGTGLTMMPGLIDTHIHMSFASISQMALVGGDAGFAQIYSTRDAKDVLLRGFTSVRDMGGNTFGLKQAIDQGVVPGPRIYLSGPVLSQTGGHGDFRFANQNSTLVGGDVPVFVQNGYAILADGVPEVLKGARENLRRGASHIKMAVGGGYASPTDPLLGVQYTYDEIAAAVSAASNWGTYVTIHAYHKEAINMAIDAGVKDIGHGQLLDKATLKKMAKKGVFLSTQPFTECHEPQLDSFSNQKLAQVCKGTEFVYKAAKDIKGLKITFGTDIFFVDQDTFKLQAKMMERLLPWYQPAEILHMATGTAGELLKMSGLRDPYPEAALGVIKEGAYADILLVKGDPTVDLKTVTNEESLLMIMKDGKIYKNTM
ncbi:amidohydrolase family protein [Shewanella olleyana]|uniref:metal-dependent hydrolase family protein n=1 Tax=Shewanella olleyana TaxID=135626 RepID=UPI00200BD39B|nr:amidohydrolase family protein [Shewanella olleyana]MCL1067417.1 amidohydrolase family protein [Shewanella olleyana]